ncbi:hypothetical protein [Burkholderia sp. MSMB1826]|uniref:hypothetical protein n=1 Tax=Burkholderia sp. MSMB1826 TaxID=1637875 RepID=UPI0012E347A0|nr:hypothetical protein [Burkholderia sp. MSMB1826]
MEQAFEHDQLDEHASIPHSFASTNPPFRLSIPSASSMTGPERKWLRRAGYPNSGLIATES